MLPLPMIIINGCCLHSYMHCTHTDTHTHTHTIANQFDAKSRKVYKANKSLSLSTPILALTLLFIHIFCIFFRSLSFSSDKIVTIVSQSDYSLCSFRSMKFKHTKLHESRCFITKANTHTLLLCIQREDKTK